LLCLFIDIPIKVSLLCGLRTGIQIFSIPSEKFLVRLISFRDLIFNIFSLFFKIFPTPYRNDMNTDIL
jgi:hypothetical protein